MKYIFFLILPILLVLSGCKDNPKAFKYYNPNPQYTWGYAFFYGDYYSDVGIENNVLSVSLFTENLSVENGNLIGGGQYLNIEELCLAPSDTLLPLGVYTINNTREPMTALPGEVPEEYPYVFIGANISYVDENGVTYMLIESGTFTVEDIVNEDEYTITFDFIAYDYAASNRQELKGKFRGKLPHYDGQRKEPTEQEAQGMLMKEINRKLQKSRSY